MSKWKGKLAKRIMAIVLSGAMVMSNMSAYAAELTPETAVETVVEEESSAEETAATESSVKPAGEETVSAEENENAETEESVVESSQSKDEVVISEDATEKTNEVETDAESSVAESESESENATEAESEEKSDATETKTKDNEEKDNTVSNGVYELDPDHLSGTYPENAQTTLTEATTAEGTGGYFKILKSARIDNRTSNSEQTFAIDGETKNIKNRIALNVQSEKESSSSERGIAFTIAAENTGTLVVAAMSGGGSAPSKIALYNAEGEKVACTKLSASNDATKILTDTEDAGAVALAGNDKPVMTWENLSSGNYYIGAKRDASSGTYTQSPNVYYMKVMEAATGSEVTPSDRGDWSSVANPAIESAALSEDKTKIEVTVSGVVAPTGVGADSIEVDVYDTNENMDDATPIETLRSTKATEADENNKHLTKFEYVPDASGSYYFMARLVRADEKDEDGNVTTAFDDKKSDLSSAVEFKLPLAKPVISSARYTETNADGKGVITVSWNATEEAEYYVVSAEYTDDANKDATIEDIKVELTDENKDATSYRQTLTANMDSTISVTVQAFRNSYNKDAEAGSEGNTAGIDYSEVSEARTINVKEPDTRVKTGTHILDMDTEFAGTANRTTLSDANNLKSLGENDTENSIYTSADGYFKLHYTKDKTRIDSGARTFEGTSKTLSVNMQGNLALGGATDDDGKEIPLGLNSYEFTVSNAPAEITVYWRAGGDGDRVIHILDAEGKEVEGQSQVTEAGRPSMVGNFTINEAGTYYLGCKDGGSNIFYIRVSEPALLDMDTEFAGTANRTTLSDANNLKSLGENDTENSIYTSADGYFKLHYTKDKTRIDSGARTFEGTSKTLSVNMQGNLALGGATDDDGKEIPLGLNSYEFTINRAPAEVTVYWRAGGDGDRVIYILDAEGKEVEGQSQVTEAGRPSMVGKFIINETGTYYLGCKNGGSNIFYIGVKEGYTSGGQPTVDRGNWDNVAAPEITDIALTNDGKITVTAKGVVALQGEGADYIEIGMYNANLPEKPLSTQKSETNTTADAEGNHLTTMTFTPTESASYTFKAVLHRENETDADGNVTAEYADKESAMSESVSFNLPLSAPVIGALKNAGRDADGKGVIEVSWAKVPEADDYTVFVRNEDGSDIKEPITGIEGLSLQIGGFDLETTVVVSVQAFGEAGESPVSDPKSVTISGKEAHTYTFDGLDYLSEANSTGVQQSAGRKLGNDDFYSVYIATGTPASGTLLRTASNNTLSFLQIYQNGGSGLRFTVNGTADASFTVASTGGGNWSVFALRDSDGNLVPGGVISGANTYTYAAGAYSTRDTALSTIDFTGLPKGTYTLLSPQLDSPANGENSRGGRIHKAVVNDDGEMGERIAWEEVAAPVISEVSYVRGQGTIQVKASGAINYELGADSLKIEMLNKDGEVVDSKVNALDSVVENGAITQNPDQTFVFTPTASGEYNFRASLVRNGEADKPMEDAASDWKIAEFVLPLATPSIDSMTNVQDGEKGGLDVMFTGVDEADYYVIAAYRNNEFNKDNSYVDIEAMEIVEDGNKIAHAKDEVPAYEATITGLDLGECYVSVQAFRNMDSALNLKAETTIVSRDESGKAASKTDWTKQDGVETSTAVSETDETSRSAVAVVRSQAANGMEKYVNGKNDRKWFHTVYGSNTSRAPYNRGAALDAIDGEGTGATPANGYRENVYTEGDLKGDLESVTVWSENGRGKVVPATTDGLSYYYTQIPDPENNNFTLSALVNAKSWSYSNGQDGFGMMVSDNVGPNNDDGDQWINAYQLVASKIEYSYRLPVRNENGEITEPGSITNESGNGTTIMRYSMRLGLGWTSKLGTTSADVAKIKAGSIVTPPNFVSESGTLEDYAGQSEKYTGNYNIVGNGVNANAIPESAMDNLITDFRLQIQKYDNAYVLRYLEVGETPADQITDENRADFVTIGEKYYKIINEKAFSDDNNNTLTQLDRNNIYVGFFAARNARINVSQISLETYAGGDAYEVKPERINPNANFVSGETSNEKTYDLTYSGNFDGTLTIFQGTNPDDINEILVSGKAIKAGTRYTFTAPMTEGDNYFVYYAKPDTHFVPGINQLMTSFDMQTNEKDPFKVVYNKFDGDEIYVSQNGAAVGTKYIVEENGAEVTYYAGCSPTYPTNVYDAVNYARAGQTIILAGGRYDLRGNDPMGSDNLLAGRNHDGTSRAYITMKAAPDATGSNRPVLDFGQRTKDKSPAFTVAGNYWKLIGFDVMGSIDGEDGIKLSGSHNILQDLRTYLNGNTGIQISRYLGSDSRADWPSYNTILNCSSYMNYDAGYEDADGFAAKLTCGDGNKFIGCISAYNADDGWDLFAKRETGSIGVVTLENCLAFNNGYLFGEEDYYGPGQDLIYRDLSGISRNTHIVSAGNGNGFKLGGDSMSGYHVLRDSIAFGNKSKGIDSNSCPDIQIYNSISFNNEMNNVALYTGGAPNTDYLAENIVSIKDSNCADGFSTSENIKPVGTQNTSKIYGANNYYWNGSKSVNNAGEEFKTSWFVHMNMTAAVFGSRTRKAISRDADGSINLNGFLEYTDDAPLNKFIGNTSADSVLDEIIDIYVFAEEYKGKAVLNDISLSSFEASKTLADAGYKWEEPDTELAAFAGTTAEFTVVADGKQNRTVAVSFIQLDGAELVVTAGDTNGNGVLNQDETWTIEAVPVISPAVDPNPALSGFNAEIKETTKLLNSSDTAVGQVYPGLNVAGGQVKFTGAGSNGDARLTAVVTLTVNGKSVKKNAALTLKVKNADNIKFESIDPADPAKVIWDSTNDDDYIQVAMDAGSFTMKDLHFVNKAFGKGVKIKVNDTNVIKLTGTTSSANGVDASFQVVNKSGDGGTATVTVTSVDDKTLVRNYIVTVSGSDLAWNAGNIEIDKAKLAGVQLAALAPFGKTMVNGENMVSVKAAYKGAKVGGASVDTNLFEVKNVTGRIYELNTSDAAAGAKSPLSKGVYTVVFQGTVSAPTEDNPLATETMDFTPITIKVTETKPSVTLKQTKKVNLFYKNGTAGSTGKLSAISKQADVTLLGSDNEAPKNDYFRFAGDSAGYDIVSIKRNPVSLSSNGKADYREVTQNNKMNITAHFEGYHDEYDITRSFTIAVEYKQPKLKLTALDKTIYTAIGMDSADVLIYDPDMEMYLSPDNATIELVTDSSNKKAYSKTNNDFIVDDIIGVNNGSGVKLALKPGITKGGTLRLSVTYDEWFNQDPIIVNQAIQVNTRLPKLTVKPAKLNINKEKFVGKEQVDAAILLSNSTGFTINDAVLTGANDKATEFLTKYVDYEITQDLEGKNVLRVSLKKDENGNFPSTADAKGTYKMDAGYSNGYSFVLQYRLGTQSEVQTAPFKLSLVSREAVTVSASGSINITNRLDSTITLKPKMQNFTVAQISNVTLTGDAANQFEIVTVDPATGVTTIRAKENAELRTGSYKLIPRFTIDLGKEGSTTITPIKPVVIRTVQPALKISGLKDALEVKLSSHNTSAQRTITVNSPAGAFITDLTQTSGLDNFALSYDAGGNNISVTIKDRAGLKEGATYKITAVIAVEGSGTNAKQQVITIPVKVIR